MYTHHSTGVRAISRSSRNRFKRFKVHQVESRNRFQRCCAHPPMCPGGNGPTLSSNGPKNCLAFGVAVPSASTVGGTNPENRGVLQDAQPGFWDGSSRSKQGGKGAFGERRERCRVSKLALCLLITLQAVESAALTSPQWKRYLQLCSPLCHMLTLDYAVQKRRST